MQGSQSAQLTFREHLLNGIKIAYGSVRVRRYRPHAFGKAASDTREGTVPVSRYGPYW
jgi:hypothetical protein